MALVESMYNLPHTHSISLLYLPSPQLGLLFLQTYPPYSLLSFRLVSSSIPLSLSLSFPLQYLLSLINYISHLSFIILPMQNWDGTLTGGTTSYSLSSSSLPLSLL